MQTSRRAKQFWKRLAQNYGARLQEQYGPTCPEDWCRVIDRTDDERLDAAMIAIRRDYLQFPPTLGQFEASIPGRRKVGEDSGPDRLAVHAVARFQLCEHQSSIPWNYFGETTDEWFEPWGEVRKNYITKGVVIPGCSSCQRPGHRVKLEDLAA